MFDYQNATQQPPPGFGSIQCAEIQFLSRGIYLLLCDRGGKKTLFWTLSLMYVDTIIHMEGFILKLFLKIQSIVAGKRKVIIP